MADDERGGVRRWAARIGSVLAMLPVLYVLSIGPVADWSIREGNNGERFESLISFYWPLLALAEHVPWFARVLEWYVEFWQ